MQAGEWRVAGGEELAAILGRARAKKGMFEGDMGEGELEIGQAGALLDRILPAAEIVKKVWEEFMNGLADPLKKL